MARLAATLIVTIPAKPSANYGNYKILTMKRSEKARYLPNTYVYPGGTISKADTSELWMAKYKLAEIEKLSPMNKNAPRPHCMTIENEIPRPVSLRITAIRETFEESGILVLEKNGELIKESDLPPRVIFKKNFCSIFWSMVSTQQIPFANSSLSPDITENHTDEKICQKVFLKITQVGVG